VLLIIYKGHFDHYRSYYYFIETQKLNLAEEISLTFLLLTLLETILEMSSGIPIYQIAKLSVGVESLLTSRKTTSSGKSFEYLTYIFEIYSDGHLILSNPQQPDKNQTISLSKVMIQEKPSSKPDLHEFTMYCQAINGQRLLLHLITSERQQFEIFHAIKEVSQDHNVDSFLPPPPPTSVPPPPPTDQVSGPIANIDPNQPNPNQQGPEVVIYQNDHLFFSAIRERNIRMAVVWKPWEARLVRLTSEGILSYTKPKRKGDIPRHKMFSCKDIEVQLMADDERDDVTDYGVIVRCHTLDHIESYFRCILDERELDRLLNALKQVAEHHNIDSLVRSQLTVEKKKKRFYLLRSKQSVMRRAVTSAMDKFDLRTKKERIISKRGAFTWLPVAGSNDLIHGSWWFVFGSVGAVVTSAVIIQNKETPFWNDDDSSLPAGDFLATWGLMCVSGIFSTLGSLAFVRAFHENPPMSPLFPNHYHFQSDELLASWLFFLATFPFVPYVAIFLAADHSGSHFAYICMLILAIIAALGTLLFVRACYPSAQEKNHKDLLLPISNWICCCCCSQKYRDEHFMNDWLGGSWCFLWATEAGTLGCFILFAKALAENNTLLSWTYGTS